MEPKTVHIIPHQELLKACKQGDPRAQREIYRLYYKPMYHTSLRILGDSMEAEDVMQEAFLAAFRHLRKTDLTVSFGGWLKRIVVNRSLDALRKRKPEMELVGDYADETIPEPAVPQEEYSVHDMVEKVRSAMTRLPEKYRLVLTLSLFEGYDHEEISQILGITASTSRAQLSRGKERLVAMMATGS